MEEFTKVASSSANPPRINFTPSRQASSRSTCLA
jgi:hypothetical protein